MKLIVLIPAYNEEDVISEVIKKIPETISGIQEIKILVVNGGSSDRTIDLQ